MSAICSGSVLVSVHGRQVVPSPPQTPHRSVTSGAGQVGVEVPGQTRVEMLFALLPARLQETSLKATGTEKARCSVRGPARNSVGGSLKSPESSLYIPWGILIGSDEELRYPKCAILSVAPLSSIHSKNGAIVACAVKVSVCGALVSIPPALGGEKEKPLSAGVAE